MSEKQEKAHIVMRRKSTDDKCMAVPVKVLDDRKDAREYVKRMNASSNRYVYSCRSAKRG